LTSVYNETALYSLKQVTTLQFSHVHFPHFPPLQICATFSFSHTFSHP